MKKDITYVSPEKFIAIVQELGVDSQKNSGWYKLTGPAKGRRVYLPTTKTKIGTVHVSGFTHDCEGLVPVVNMGGVKQLIDFSSSRTEDQILSTFRSVLEHMLTLSDAEPKKRPAPMATKKVAKENVANMVIDVSGDDWEETERLKAEKLARLQAYAEKMGSPVSESTLRELAPSPRPSL